MKHGMQCLARLVRLLLGSEAIAEGKLDCGTELAVLGAPPSLHTCVVSVVRRGRWRCSLAYMVSTAGHRLTKSTVGCVTLGMRCGRRG